MCLDALIFKVLSSVGRDNLCHFSGEKVKKITGFRQLMFIQLGFFPLWELRNAANVAK